MITCVRQGKHLVITPSGIDWSDDESRATVFASAAALRQFLATGRGRKLRFVRWVTA